MSSVTNQQQGAGGSRVRCATRSRRGFAPPPAPAALQIATLSRLADRAGSVSGFLDVPARDKMHEPIPPAGRTAASWSRRAFPRGRKLESGALLCFRSSSLEGPSPLLPGRSSGKAQDRTEGAGQKLAQRRRVAEPCSFLPDRTMTLHPTPMTTQPTQSTETTPVEPTPQPTWTDVARAVFRSGKRQMSLEEFVVIFFRLFGELADRCDKANVIGMALIGAFEELQESGFVDKATLYSFMQGLAKMEGK